MSTPITATVPTDGQTLGALLHRVAEMRASRGFNTTNHP
jgi:hypothetical protein